MMPAQTPTTFASAAAGSGAAEGGTGRAGPSDWSRPRMNGTQTFRRPSQLSTTNTSHQRDNSQSVQSPSAGVYVPPHISSAQQSSARNVVPESRYSRDQMLDIFKSLGAGTNKEVANLFTEGWIPGQSNGSGASSWGRREETKDITYGPEVCWDDEGQVQPLGLIEMDEEEKEMFATSVNSLLKPPQPKQQEGVQTPGTGGRKQSISSGTTHNSGPSSGRPGARRRDTSDSFSGNPLASPTFQRGAARDDNPLQSPIPPLIRRRTETKDTPFGERGATKLDTSSETIGGFGTLKRSTTNPLSAGLGGPLSPWTSTPQSAGFGPMGAFGSQADQSSTPVDKKGFGSLRGESRFMRDFRSKENDDASKGRDRPGMHSLNRLTETLAEEIAAETSSERRSNVHFASVIGESDRIGSAALGGDEAEIPQREAGETPQASRPDFSSFRDRLHQPKEPALPEQDHGFPGAVGLNEPMSPTDTNPYRSPEAQRSTLDRSHMEEDPQELLQSIYGMNQPMRSHGLDISEQNSRTSSAGPRATSGFGAIGNPGGMTGSIGWPASGASGPSRGSAFADPIFGALGDLSTPGAAGIFGAAVSSQSGFGAIGRTSRPSSILPTPGQDQPGQQPGLGDPSLGHANMLGSGMPGRDTDSPAHTGRYVLDELFANFDGGRGRNTGLSGTPLSRNELPTGQGLNLPQTSNMPGMLPNPATAGASQMNGLFGQLPDDDLAQLPPAQKRTMVMPDRMRWVYRDPQGNQQGPWSGLEMHDWYKAGFFSPELQVKKVEDKDYEPLAQLIRRIGNSREPFLVPQIGIPHGPAVATPGITTAASMAGLTAPTNNTGAIQPPFAGSFPSFGTTLTADQQNALEQRKQEEQFLMARQKEMLHHHQQQQAMMRQQQNMLPPGPPHGLHPQQGLHHHSSAHSLQSQPSFGSIGAPPGGFPPGQMPMPPQQPGMPPSSFFEQSRHGFGPVGPPRGDIPPSREGDLPASMDRLSLGHIGQAPPGSSGGLQHDQQIMRMLEDRARLQREAEQFEALQRSGNLDPRDRETFERLQQFQQLRAQEQLNQLPNAQAGVIGRPQGAGAGPAPGEMPAEGQRFMHENMIPEPVSSLLQGQDQVRDTFETKQTEAEEEEDDEDDDDEDEDEVDDEEDEEEEHEPAQPDPALALDGVANPWQSIEPAEQAIIPPPQSISPLPAPAAQRTRSNVAAALAADTRSRSQTPIDTPSAAAIAPWARDPAESTITAKGPSLKEIQEAEARKAARQEAIAAEARRVLAEQERLAAAAAAANAPPPAPGLPTSANWAAAQASASTTAAASAGGAGGSAWAKPLAGKQPTSAASAKKTLEQIQKEEEVRKNKAAAAAAAAANASGQPGSPASFAGKRYADLAGKAGAPPNPAAAAGGAWTTVGAGGGKAKTPAAAGAVQPAPPQRSASIGTLGAGVVGTAVKKPAAPSRSSTMAAISNPVQAAGEEVAKWAKMQLARGASSGINVDELVKSLMTFPPDVEIISDTIYSASTTLNGRQFAEEFLRRRKLAEKGDVAPAGDANFGVGQGSNGDAKGSGGWSEVAKKAPASHAKEDHQFKVVAGKKKGKK